jgi:hypothetical protein
MSIFSIIGSSYHNVNEKFIIFSAQGNGRGFYSTNGTTWTLFLFPTNHYVTNCIYVNGKFIAACGGSYLYSEDGLNWSENNWPNGYGNYNSRHIAYGNNTYVVIQDLATYAFYSNDLITWSASTLSLPETIEYIKYYWNEVSYVNNKFIIIPLVDWNNQPTQFYNYSSDGINWIEGLFPETNYYSSVAYGNNAYFVTGQTASAYSSDGVIWSEVQIPHYPRSIIFFKNKFIATSINSDFYIFISNDGLTWSVNTINDFHGYYSFQRSLAYSGSQLLVIFNYNSNYGATGKYALSKNGLSWNLKSFPLPYTWDGLIGV